MTSPSIDIQRFVCEPVLTEGQLTEAKHVRQTVFITEQQVEPELEWDEWDTPATIFQANFSDKTPSIYHWIVRDTESNQVVATARLRRMESYGKVERVAVLADYRQFGLGKLVMQHLETEAKRLGFVTLKLHAQCHCQGFYEKLGYEPSDGEVFMEADIPHVAMQKAL